jgi:hypothetical protein
MTAVTRNTEHDVVAAGGWAAGGTSSSIEHHSEPTVLRGVRKAVQAAGH